MIRTLNGMGEFAVGFAQGFAIGFTQSLAARAHLLWRNRMPARDLSILLTCEDIIANNIQSQVFQSYREQAEQIKHEQSSVEPTEDRCATEFSQAAARPSQVLDVEQIFHRSRL